MSRLVLAAVVDHDQLLAGTVLPILAEVGIIQVSVSVVENRHSQFLAVSCPLLCGHHLALAAGISQSVICLGRFPIDFCGRAR